MDTTHDLQTVVELFESEMWGTSDGVLVESELYTILVTVARQEDSMRTILFSLFTSEGELSDGLDGKYLVINHILNPKGWIASILGSNALFTGIPVDETHFSGRIVDSHQYAAKDVTRRAAQILSGEITISGMRFAKYQEPGLILWIDENRGYGPRFELWDPDSSSLNITLFLLAGTEIFLNGVMLTAKDSGHKYAPYFKKDGSRYSLYLPSIKPGKYEIRPF